MKAINKILCLLLTTVMLLTMVTPVMAASEATVKMYAVDGRTIDVPQSKVEAYSKVGWYDSPIITVYAADGRTKKIPSSKKDAYLKVGWYDSPLITVYAADGRTKKIPSSKKDAYLKVGWYDSPLITMYAADGRTAKVPSSKKDAYKKVGWFATKPVKMYATDGRTKYVESTEVDAYKKVGWFATKPVKMHAADGRSIYVESTAVDAYKKVGWSTQVLYKPDGSLKKPYLAANANPVIYQRYSWHEKKKIVVNVTGYARGDKAEAIGGLENAGSGQEWILLKIKVKYLEGKEELTSLSFYDWLYKKSGSSYGVYDKEYYFDWSWNKEGDIYSKGIYNCSTYAGGTMEGYLAVLTDKGAEMPIIKIPGVDGDKFIMSSGAPELVKKTQEQLMAEHPIFSKYKITLPAVPQKLSNYTTSYDAILGKKVDVLQSTANITEITYKLEEGSGGKANLKILFKGEKTYDTNGAGQTTSFKIGWKLYDSEGYVVEDGTTYTLGIAAGEKFKDVEEKIYSLEPGSYRLVIMGVNGL